jgi:undecaprenyl diphosphate synthase
MGLLKKFIRTEQRELIENEIRLRVIGEITRLPEDIQELLRQVIERTRANRALLLNIALNYGGRDEIVRAVRQIAAAVREGRLAPEEISADVFAAHLDTRGISDPDLLIRTSGEMRVSNFLLWQIAYAEIYVTDTLWPDFSREEFVRILQSYQKRERRYGKVAD